MLNKKILRKFADNNPAPAIPPNHGLLHAQQIDFIVRTDTRIIDHRKLLILYIHSRQEAAQGDFRPLWTIFHSRDDYITLARRPDGTVSWRTAAFEKLGKDWSFARKCVFYSARDQKRVSRYFRNDAPGFAPLLQAQAEILDRRRKKRERQRDQAVRARMKDLPALPRDLATWAHRNIMPAYFFYDHAKKGKASGICSACGQEAVLTGVKHNSEGICPHCGRTLKMKSRGRIGHLYDRETCQVIQRTKTGELMVRIIKATCSYQGENPGMLVYENARQFIRLDENGAVQHDNYYYSYKESKWKRGDRPRLFPYQYHYEGDTCGHLYCVNLPKVLSGTPWRYCPVHTFYAYDGKPMEMYSFLAAHIEHPKLEYLVKVGFYRLAADLAYGRIRDGLLDESQNRTHRLLGVRAEDVDFLRELDVDRHALKIYQDYCRRNLKDRQRLLAWQLENKVERDLDIALGHMSVHKLLRYLDTQWDFLRFRLTRYKAQRYRSMQDLVTEYQDYVEMLGQQGHGLSNSDLFPKDLQKAHDRAAHRIQMKADAKLRRDFDAAMKAISRHLDFEADGMKIIVPSSPDEIISEGAHQAHCVANYIEKVAQKKCLILFLRKCSDEATPFYTIEVRGKQVIQVRGKQNSEATPEVNDFIDRWTREVLQAA